MCVYPFMSLKSISKIIIYDNLFTYDDGLDSFRWIIHGHWALQCNVEEKNIAVLFYYLSIEVEVLAAECQHPPRAW